jgi:hypothetical protein
LENYKGTYILSEDGDIIDCIEGLMWFAAPHGAQIFYSNQKDNDYLYCLDTESLTESCLLQKSCGNITVFDDTLFFLDETDGLIYKFNIQNGKVHPLMKERVFAFILRAGIFYCAFAKGLLEFNFQSEKANVLTDHIPICLSYTSGRLIFADRSQDFALSGLIQGQNEPKKINLIKTQSIVADEHHIYAANLLDNRSVARVDIASGESIRFCGEKADKLHIVGEYLYFQNQNDKNAWYRMSLSGGRSIRLLPVLA